MRQLLSAAALFVSLGSTAIAGPQEEALQVVERWTRAFTNSDVDAIVKLYASDALFLGTSSKAVVVDPAEIRKVLRAGAPEYEADGRHPRQLLNHGGV